MIDKPLEKWWVNLDDQSLNEFIEGWFSEVDEGEHATTDFGGNVVLMNFLATEEFQWNFILRSFGMAEPRHYGDLAAGCVEQLLAKHGENWIEKFESEAAKNIEFKIMLSGVWQNSMSDELWARVQNLQVDTE